jgi:nitroreductase
MSQVSIYQVFSQSENYSSDWSTISQVICQVRESYADANIKRPTCRGKFYSLYSYWFLNFYQDEMEKMDKNIFDLINDRRSVRKYKPGKIPREIIDRCLEAARLAPSACNSQPWSFIVADKEPMRTKVAQAAFSGVYAMNKFAMPAPVLIAVLTERSKFMAALAGRFRGIQYSLVDIGIACAFLSLAAEAEGVGACLLGWFDERAVKNVLGLPGNVKIDIMISMGYSAEDKSVVKVRKMPQETWRYV